MDHRALKLEVLMVHSQARQLVGMDMSGLLLILTRLSHPRMASMEDTEVLHHLDRQWQDGDRVMEELLRRIVDLHEAMVRLNRRVLTMTNTWGLWSAMAMVDHNHTDNTRVDVRVHPNRRGSTLRIRHDL
jgi:hypothetical protein